MLRMMFVDDRFDECTNNVPQTGQSAGKGTDNGRQFFI
jgi:hypothetical protein